MGEFPVLDAYRFDERDWTTYEDLAADFEWEVPDEFNIATYCCDRWADQDGSRVALYEEAPDGTSTSYTFAEVRDYANQLAAFLSEQGIGRGDRIAVNGVQRVEPLITHFAAYKLGAVSVPLSILIGGDGVRYRCNDCEVSAFVASQQGYEAYRGVEDDISTLETVLPFGFDAHAEDRDFWDALKGRSRTFETATTAAEDSASIIYTSGTTGDPKGVVHAHRHLLGVLPGFARAKGMDYADDAVLRTLVEWSWIGSLTILVLPGLYYGLPIVAYESAGFEPEKEFELIEKYGITTVGTPATGARMMMGIDDPAERFDLASLESFESGGEAVDQQLVEWVRDTFDEAVFVEGFGQTEAPMLITDAPHFGYEHRPEHMGIPGLGHEVRVVDPDTREPIEEAGEPGELAIAYEGNPMLFKEYYGLPEKTANKIQDGWLLTEDLVEIDGDGYVKYVSRLDDIIISSGYKLSPVEIEETLQSHENVMNAAVIGVPHETRGEIPKGFVSLAPEVEPSEDLADTLQSFVKAELAKYQYPREIEFVEELPRTTTGKVRRKALKEREGVT